MGLRLTAENMPYDIELCIGYGTFMKLRIAFLERFDELMRTNFSSLYEFGIKHRARLSEDPEFRKDFNDAWNDHLSEISLKTRFLREHKLDLDDFSVISVFAWHSDCGGELSVNDCQKLRKFLSLFLEIEEKREEQGEDNLFWYIPKCKISECDMFSISDEDLMSDGIERLYDVINFACEHEVPLQFI